MVAWHDLEVFYAKVKFSHLGICMEKSENYLFLKFFGAYNLKVGSYTDTELHDLMKLHEYQRSSHYLTFYKGHFIFKLKFCFSQKLLGYLKPNIM